MNPPSAAQANVPALLVDAVDSIAGVKGNTGERQGSAGSSDIRERVFTAAGAAFQRFGVSKTTIDDIAEASGVSRASIYRHIPGGRDEIVLTVHITEAERRFRPIVEALADEPTLGHQFVRGLPAVVDLIRSDEQLAHLFSPDFLTSSSSVHGGPDVLVAATVWFMRDFVAAARARGEIRPHLSDEEIGAWLTRMLFSILTFKSKTTSEPGALATFVVRFFLPALLTEPVLAQVAADLETRDEIGSRRVGESDDTIAS